MDVISNKQINICEKKKKIFFKRYYKEALAIILGVLLGVCIGSIGKVPESSVDKANSQIENNEKIIKNKEGKLKTLENKKLELKESLAK